MAEQSARMAMAAAIRGSVPADRGLAAIDALMAADAALFALAGAEESPEQLRADRDRLQAIVDALVGDDDVDLTLRRLEVNGGSLNGSLGMPHWAIRMLAVSLAESLDQVGGPNYVEQHIAVELRAGGHESFVVTVQRPGGKSPHELRTRAEGACRKALDFLENGAVFVAGDVETFDGVTRASCMRELRDVLGS